MRRNILFFLIIFISLFITQCRKDISEISKLIDHSFHNKKNIQITYISKDADMKHVINFYAQYLNNKGWIKVYDTGDFSNDSTNYKICRFIDWLNANKQKRFTLIMTRSEQAINVEIWLVNTDYE